ncbi:hypothetical protein HanRHA438_Chr13g0610601 [Helianthus annuus]|nr:hypothetical protein HanRHA438_Chr13g0610601 [Helianthus annuus]
MKLTATMVSCVRNGGAMWCSARSHSKSPNKGEILFFSCLCVTSQSKSKMVDENG